MGSSSIRAQPGLHLHHQPLIMHGAIKLFCKPTRFEGLLIRGRASVGKPATDFRQAIISFPFSITRARRTCAILVFFWCHPRQCYRGSERPPCKASINHPSSANRRALVWRVTIARFQTACGFPFLKSFFLHNFLFHNVIIYIRV